MDFWFQLGFTAMLKLLKDKKQIRQYREVLRKIYLNLHANRLLFLTSDDMEVLKHDVMTVK